MLAFFVSFHGLARALMAILILDLFVKAGNCMDAEVAEDLRLRHAGARGAPPNTRQPLLTSRQLEPLKLTPENMESVKHLCECIFRMCPVEGKAPPITENKADEDRDEIEKLFTIEARNKLQALGGSTTPEEISELFNHKWKGQIQATMIGTGEQNTRDEMKKYLETSGNAEGFQGFKSYVRIWQKVAYSWMYLFPYKLPTRSGMTISTRNKADHVSMR